MTNTPEPIKCKINHIGRVLGDMPIDWVFDGEKRPGAIGIYTRPDGTVLYAGWSVEEMRIISKAHKAAVIAELERLRDFAQGNVTWDDFGDHIYAAITTLKETQ